MKLVNVHALCVTFMYTRAVSLVDATPRSGNSTTGSSEVTARGRTSHVLTPVEVIIEVIIEVIMEAIITNLPVDGHEQHDSSAPGGGCRSYVQQKQGGHQQGGAQENPPPAHKDDSYLQR